MPELRKFALAEVEPGRVALCRIHGDVLEAADWKEARARISVGALDNRTGYGFAPPPDDGGIRI